jgi:hypothetical protein
MSQTYIYLSTRLETHPVASQRASALSTLEAVALGVLAVQAFKNGTGFRITEGFKYFVKGRFSSPSRVKNSE